MTITPGSRLGPYEVVAPLGAGGMGHVYRARDMRLGRDVAIKVLPADVVRNADRRARFEREAHAVAALSHPNILAIFDIGSESDHLYVVTELLEGETLTDRLTQGAPPVRKAIEIAAADYADDGSALTWAGGDTVAFSPNSTGGLRQVPASGGAELPLTEPDPDHGETGHL